MSKKILLVDDDESNLFLLVDNLEDLGCETICARNGEEAWEILLAEHDKIALVLLDRMMPGINGMEVLMRIKDNPDMSRIPIIMQTAAAQKEQVEEGIHAGVYYYLTKPFEESQLQSIVRAALENYGNLSELRSNLRHHRNIWRLVREAQFEYRTIEDARNLSLILANCYPDPDRVAFGLREMMVNAVEHGNLDIGYQGKTTLNNRGIWEEEVKRLVELPEHINKKVLLNFKRCDDSIVVTLQDEGKGFRWEQYVDFEPLRMTDNHGRGIAMSRVMSFDKIEYCGSGNIVMCVVNIENPLEKMLDAVAGTGSH